MYFFSNRILSSVFLFPPSWSRIIHFMFYILLINYLPYTLESSSCLDFKFTKQVCGFHHVKSRIYLLIFILTSLFLQKCFRGRRASEAACFRVREQFHDTYGKHCEKVDRQNLRSLYNCYLTTAALFPSLLPPISIEFLQFS